MANSIITISREFGSGGRTIAKKSQRNWNMLIMTRRSLKRLRKAPDTLRNISPKPVNIHLPETSFPMHSWAGTSQASLPLTICGSYSKN